MWGLRPQSGPLALSLYCILTWWPGCQMANAKKRLSRIQRLACLGIAEAMHTTPSGAIEAHNDVPPLDLVTEDEARSEALRL